MKSRNHHFSLKSATLAALLTASITAACFTGCGGAAQPAAEQQPTAEQPATEQQPAAEQRSVTKLDDDGYLYYMDYTKDYYGPEIIEALRKVAGCSNFFTHNTEGEPITCRNYDYPHRLPDEKRSLTGLNVVLHCKPEGKYESIALADAIWCDENNPLLRQNGPDEQDFDPDMLDIIPYECMDGINEKGLCVSVLRVDIKAGDQPARLPVGSSMLLRYMLDDCATVDEAVAKTQTTILLPEDWQDCHFLVTDADGHSVVIESRNSKISVIDSDICTNFYLGSDDMEDYYRSGKLREKAVKMTGGSESPDYHYGYGHGYHRFATLLSQLERYRDTTREDYYTIMPESTALVLLQSVAQNPFTNASGISMTQYSAIYNNAKRTVEVWSFQDYSESFVFGVTGERIE